MERNAFRCNSSHLFPNPIFSILRVLRYLRALRVALSSGSPLHPLYPRAGFPYYYIGNRARKQSSPSLPLRGRAGGSRGGERR